MTHILFLWTSRLGFGMQCIRIDHEHNNFYDFKAILLLSVRTYAIVFFIQFDFLSSSSLKNIFLRWCSFCIRLTFKCVSFSLCCSHPGNANNLLFRKKMRNKNRKNIFSNTNATFNGVRFNLFDCCCVMSIVAFSISCSP